MVPGSCDVIAWCMIALYAQIPGVMPGYDVSAVGHGVFRSPHRSTSSDGVITRFSSRTLIENGNMEKRSTDA